MTRLGAKIAVEPLDDERYARIENQVMAAFRASTADRAPRRGLTARLGWLAPAVAAACALALAYVVLRPRGSDVAERGPEQPARMVTDAAGTVRYQLGDADILVGPDTTLDVWREPAGAVHVALIAGAVDCQVDPAPSRPPFLVHAGDVLVTVVGTEFRVERDDHDVRVSVTRGTVRVDAPGGSRMLGAGESWSGKALLAAAEGAGDGGGGRAGAGQERGGADPGAEHDGRENRGEDGQADSSGDGPGDASALAHGGPDGPAAPGRLATPGRLDRGHDALAPDSPVGENARPRGARTRSGTGSGGNGRDGSARATSSKRTPEQRELAKDRPARGQPPAQSQDLAALVALESDDPGAAVTGFREHALGRGADAEFALYSQAYLQYFALGQDAAALAALDHYQRRFARGAHRESALWLRIHILCDRTGDLEKCRAAAHTYLSRFPSGSHRALASRIIHWEL